MVKEIVDLSTQVITVKNVIIENDDSLQDDIILCTLCNKKTIQDNFQCTNCEALVCFSCKKCIHVDEYTGIYIFLIIYPSVFFIIYLKII